MTVLALIPARAGSKGVPGKNLRAVGGRSLVARAVETARASGVCDHVLVSTEDDAIAAEARRAGAEVPFLRPAHLAGDETAMPPVIEHAVTAFEAHLGHAVGTLVFLEATVPFRTPQQIAEAVARFDKGDVRSVVTVCPLERKPENILEKHPDGTVTRYVREPRNVFARRQDMDHICRVSSGAYVVGREDWMATRQLILEPVGFVDMESHQSINIDSELDLMLAELVAERYGI
ncbi:MAG: acylneuraminate cytidylyltransferase family protein [Alphaproteobacteria bacterium]|nr:acylneuraminate cytidylyltransferase family protein [Alphaproteobacteria bacterium]